MHLNWHERLEQHPSLREIKNWPFIAVDTLPQAKRRGFLRNQQIVAHVLAGQPLKQVAAQFHISPSKVTRLMTRCLAGDESDWPVLMNGLVPSQHIHGHQRRHDLPSFTALTGTSCAFSGLLQQLPQVKEKLDEMIKAWLSDKDTAQVVEPQNFHSEFKRILAEEQWPTDRYPYTQSDLAYESARTYFHQRHEELLAEKQAKRQSKRVVRRREPYDRALKSIQIDEHHTDNHTRLHIELNNELIPLRVARIDAIVALDVATDCVLGFQPAFTTSPNQLDFLSLLEHMRNTEPLPTLTTPGFEYSPGAGFPAAVLKDFPVSFGLTQLDNALMHMAYSIRETLCSQQGSTKNLGLAGQAKTRNWVEYAFAYINQHASHRFAATTGSHSQDSIRESRKNAKGIPTTSVQTFIEALRIVLTHHNVSPQAQLGYATPLEVYEEHCRHHYLRYIPESLYRSWDSYLSRCHLPIKWLKHENRRPHVNFYGVRYQGPGLTQVVSRDHSVTVTFDQRDIRQLHAYSDRGEDLGFLLASRSWQRFPHSLATRRYIKALVRAHRLSETDPLAGYFRWLLDNKKNPKKVLQLIRVFQEYTQDGNDVLYLGSDTPTIETLNNSETKNGIIHDWSIDQSFHEE